MNFKINLWTLLFVLAAGALVYVVSEKHSPKLPDITQIVNIPASVFNDRYQNYNDNYIRVMKDTTLKLDSLIGVKNLPILYYELAETELDQMYEHYAANGQPKVFVYPTMKETVDADSSVLDLVFAISDSLGNNTRYFDFSTPCPTACDSVKISKL